MASGRGLGTIFDFPAFCRVNSSDIVDPITPIDVAMFVHVVDLQSSSAGRTERCRSNSQLPGEGRQCVELIGVNDPKFAIGVLHLCCSGNLGRRRSSIQGPDYSELPAGLLRDRHKPISGNELRELKSCGAFRLFHEG